MMRRKLTFSRNGILLLLAFASGMLFSGCRKDKKNPMTFEIEAYMPHTNAPVSGIKWKIVEMKSSGALSFDPPEPTGWTLEGETDLNGMAKGEFIPFKNLDYFYHIEFDYSAMDLPLGEYSVTKGPTTYALMNRPNTGDNNYEIRILPMMSTQFNFKNLNCFDASDTFKYKSYNADEKQYPMSQGMLDNLPWLEGPSLNGCVDYIGPFGDRLAGHYVFHWEALREDMIEKLIGDAPVQATSSKPKPKWLEERRKSDRSRKNR